MATAIDPTNVLDWDEPLNTTPMFTSLHVFSTGDITVTFDGQTVGSLNDPLSVFDTTGASGTKDTKDGVTLYPIDSEFGFIVSDFANASQKELDGDYAEGWAGDLVIDGQQAGIVVSDAPTETFKTPALLGTWLSGLGGNTVKASTEHYVVMQNVLSDQAFPGDPDALYPLDNDLYVIGGDYDGQRVADVIPLVGDVNGDGISDIKDVLAPNETEIDVNIAAGSDYSVTLKDDGKLLYRWGNTIKKPNDVRLEASLDLPEDWAESDPTTGLRNLYQVTSAELVVHHTITNNPNDQVRPEDFENEAAIGQLPTYQIIADYNLDGAGPREVWVSSEDYHAGDGTLYEAGTILRDDNLADIWASSDMAAIGATDGATGFTNAWYTTMNREPFEPVLNADGTEYAGSGPRWRLQPDKYGQDLPSVVIPADPSLPPPPTKGEEKYEVGAETQTVLNLLDWGAPAVPLSISAGWQDQPGEVSENGMNYSSGFDMAVYIKGDIKPATVYSAELVMDYDLITPFAAGTTITGTGEDDFLVGLGANTFNSGDGNDLMVLSYGSTLSGAALTSSTVIGFTVGEDALGLIDLGVDHDNFDDRVTQTVNAGNLEIYLDRDGIGTQHGEVLLATLTGITETLDMEEDFLLANPSGAAQAEIIIDGTAGADMLLGSTGNDMIFALAGDDVVLGLAGDDQIDGGEGSDTASYAQAEGDVSVYLEWTGLDVGGGEGADSLISIENLTGSDFDDRLVGDSESNVLTGGAGNDRLIGKGGDDILLGEAGIDALIGETGSDELDGGADRDYLYGNLGEDRLYGGAGDDNLHGGSGAGLLDGASDVFIYRGTADGGGGYDRILDFENGLDQIDLSAFGFTDFTNDVAALASEMDAGLKIKFAPGDVLFIENFALADFDATDVLLA